MLRGVALAVIALLTAARSEECTTDDATVKLKIVTPGAGAVVESPLHLRTHLVFNETGALSQCVLAEPREWWSCAAAEPAELGVASPSPIQVDAMPNVCVRMDEVLGLVEPTTLTPPLILSPERHIAWAWLERRSFGQQIGKRMSASTSTFQVSAPQPVAYYQPQFGCTARDYLPQLQLPCDYARDAQLNLTWTTVALPLFLTELTAGSTDEVIALFGDQFGTLCREARAQQRHTLEIEACVCEIEGHLVSHLVEFCERCSSNQFQGLRVLKDDERREKMSSVSSASGTLTHVVDLSAMGNGAHRDPPLVDLDDGGADSAGRRPRKYQPDGAPAGCDEAARGGGVRRRPVRTQRPLVR